MKNNLIKNKGITLIALVITIIVLLILAGVSISMLAGENGIIKKAKQAKEETEIASKEEQEQLNEIERQLNGLPSGKWYLTDNETITDGETVLKIGDIIKYDSTTSDKTYTSKQAQNGYGDQTFSAKSYKGDWIVWGIDDGKIQIIPTKNILTTDEKDFYLQGINACKYGGNELNQISEIYAYGKGAESARSLTASDINKLTGYKYDENYGIDVTYKRTDATTVEYSYYKNGEQEKGTYTSNKDEDEFFDGIRVKYLDIGESITLTQNAYIYNIENDYKNNINENVYNALYPKEDDNQDSYGFWLTENATQLDAISYSQKIAKYYGIRYCHLVTDKLGIDYTESETYTVGEMDGRDDYGVRPIVTLKSNIILSESGANTWNINN